MYGVIFNNSGGCSSRYLLSGACALSRPTCRTNERALCLDQSVGRCTSLQSKHYHFNIIRYFRTDLAFIPWILVIVARWSIMAYRIFTPFVMKSKGQTSHGSHFAVNLGCLACLLDGARIRILVQKTLAIPTVRVSSGAFDWEYTDCGMRG